LPIAHGWLLREQSERPMRILAIDMGTGTQDILLFDSDAPVENSVKLVMPSATEIAARRIRGATAASADVLLSGVTMGGGPCAWALEAHLKAGLKAYATPEAAKTFDDDLDAVAAMGVTVISEDESANLKAAERIEMRDLDLDAIRRALAAFEVDTRFDGLALGCLDHGASPPGYSDRLFRFDHLRRIVRERNDLRAFAYLPGELPDYLTRARSMLAGRDIDVPAVFLDTGPAAALGALHDERVRCADEQLVLNLGNMHALAFHLSGTHIHSLYEHHTGEMTDEQIESFTDRLLTGELTQDEVFNSKGHGVYYVDTHRGAPQIVAVTGPRRSRLRGSSLNPYFAAPHGDMMISGCFGLLDAFAEKYPDAREAIEGNT
jgi:uncharacterized protein (DUF1786 family)